MINIAIIVNITDHIINLPKSNSFTIFPFTNSLLVKNDGLNNNNYESKDIKLIPNNP